MSYNILVEHDTNLIKDYNYDFILLADCIVRPAKNSARTLVYSDLSAGTCNVYQIETPIEAFVGNKYMFVGNVVSANPEYIEPKDI